MKSPEQHKLISVGSGFIGFLILLFVALSCAEPTTRTEPISLRSDGSAQNGQDKKPNPVSTPVNAAEITGKVVGVSDGDTITVLDKDKKQYKIRLQGIDSPESGQSFGQAAKQNLSDLIFGKTVNVLIYKKDPYGRDVGTVFLEGKDINLEQIKAGYAWHYKKYQSEQSNSEREEYSTAEMSARAGQIGLWRDGAPVAPEEWRAGKRGNSAIDKSKSNLPPSVVVSGEPETPTKTDNKDLTVYVTRTGEKYHRAGCRYLSRSQIPISLKEAQASYDACSVCKPPK